MAEKIKILFLGASPADRHPRRLGEEMREIERAIQTAKLRDAFVLETRMAMRPSDLQRALLQFEPHIVHFSGYGSPQAEIILEDEDGASLPVSQTALCDLFKVLRDNVRIVVLNACHSQAQAKALNEIIDYAIGTSQTMQESAAVAFAAAFYQALAFQRSVQTAFDLACIAIDLKGLDGGDNPALLVRQGVDPTEPFLLQKPPPIKAEQATLTQSFHRLAHGAASEADRDDLRRALLAGQLTLTYVDESVGPEFTLLRDNGCLRVELAYARHDDMQAALYPTPHDQMPPPPGSIWLGRELEVSRLRQLLERSRTVAAPVVLGGLPGVGKTALASVICYHPDTLTAFPDGVLWTQLGQTPQLFYKLDAWGRVLTGMDGLRRFPTTAEASSRLADWLRQRRMLLVVDDVWESEHARPFLLGGSGSAVLLTTRWPNVARELSSDNRRSYTLPALPEESALQLLRCLAPAIVATHPSHCRALASDLEHLPLALHLAGRLLRYEAGLGLNAAVMFDELRAEIKNTHGDSRYAAVPGLRHNLKTLLDRSLSRLDERARDAFAYLGAHAHKSAAFELETLQTSWGTADTRPLVSQLVGLGLLEPGIHGRFRMHTLLVNYAYGLLTSPGYRGRTERNHRF